MTSANVRYLVVIGVLAAVLLYLPSINSIDAAPTTIPKDYILAIAENADSPHLNSIGLDDSFTSALILIDPNTGEQTILPTYLMGDAVDMQIGPNGDIIVVDYEGAIKSTQLSNFFTTTCLACITTYDVITQPVSFTVDGNGDFIVVDANSGLFKVDKTTGIPTLITSDGYISDPTDVTLKLTNYVVSIEDGTLVLVDSTDGTQSLMAENMVGTDGPNAPTTNVQISGGSSVIDTFTTTGNTDLDSHTPDTGNQWVEQYNTGSTKAQVRNGADMVFANEDVNNIGKAYLAKPAPTSKDQILSMTIGALETDSGSKGWGMFGRMTDDSNFYFVQVLPNTHSQDSLKLFLKADGINTELGSVDVTLALGDIIKLEITDATKKVFHNGIEQISSINDKLQSIGEWGIYFGNYAGGNSAHIRSTWYLDDFVAENGNAGSCIAPTNAYVDEAAGSENYAVCDGDESQLVEFAYQGLGLNIPSTATITGLEVNLDHAHQDAVKSGYWSVSLLDDSGIPDGDYKIGADDVHTAFQSETFGDSEDLWSVSLTPAIVNDPDFGVLVNYTQTYDSGSNDGLLDFVGVTVHYSEGVLDDSTRTIVTGGTGNSLTGNKKVIEINKDTGVQRTCSTGYDDISELNVDSNGDIIVTDSGTNSIYRVDLNSCAKTLITSDGYFVDGILTTAVVPVDISVDEDGDGIFDVVDTQPTVFSNDVTDVPLAGVTSMEVIDRGDQNLEIMEVPNDEGIFVFADNAGGSTPSEISLCSNTSTIYLDPGDGAIIKCGSVIVNVVHGDIEIVHNFQDGRKLSSTLDSDVDLYFEPKTFTIESRSGSVEITITHDNGVNEEIALEEFELISIDPVDEPVVDVLVDEPVVDVLVDEPVVDVLVDEPVVDVLVDEPVVDVLVDEPVVDVLVDEPVVDVLVEEIVPVLDEDAIKAKQDKESAEKEAIKELKKKQKEKSNKKSELTSQRNELKQIRSEMKTMKTESNSDELSKRFEGLVSKIQTTLNILKNEFDYEKEYKNELFNEIKEQKDTDLLDTKTVAEKNFRHKIGSKLSLLAKSNDPISTGKDLGLKFKNGQTTISLAFNTDNPDVVEHLNSIGRIDAASGNYVQLTLDLENLNDLKSIPGLEQITPVIPATRNIESQDN